MAEQAITAASPVRDLRPPLAGGETESLAASRLRKRAWRTLWRAAIVTVGELTAISAQDITDVRGAGTGTAGEIRRVLAAHGLTLKDDEDAVRTEAAVSALVRAGLRRSVAARFARESWPSGEIAPGIRIEVDRG